LLLEANLTLNRIAETEPIVLVFNAIGIDIGERHIDFSGGLDVGVEGHELIQEFTLFLGAVGESPSDILQLACSVIPQTEMDLRRRRALNEFGGLVDIDLETTRGHRHTLR
jgi:hypothetical protein